MDAPPAPPPAPTTAAVSPLLGRIVPLLIVLAALGLRLWGIGWALPNETRFFSYHPDESMVVSAALRTNPFLLLLDPGFYNYGSLSILLDSAAIHLGSAWHLVTDGPMRGIPSASALLASRLVSAFLGAGTCAFLYGTGRRLYSPVAGVVAAIFYALTPLAVQHGHFATVDVPATFFVAGAIFFAARHLEPTSCRPRDLIWCGLWSGLAAATKYNALLVVLAGVVAWWIAPKRSILSLLLLLGATLFGFLFGCPAILLNPQGTFAAIAFESVHVRTGHGNVFLNTPPAFIYHALFNLNWGLGWPLLIASGVAVVYAIVRRRPGDLLLLAFAVPYYVLIGVAEVKFARYTLPLFPPLALFVGGLIPWPLPDAKAKQVQIGVLGALGAAMAFALLLSLAFDNIMVRPDPRDEAAAFLKTKNVQSVGFATGPWFYSPPLNPLFAAPNPQTPKKAAEQSVPPPTLIPADGEWNTAQLQSTSPEAVPVSELNEYGDAQRAKISEATDYIATLEKLYPNRTVFSDRVQVFGLKFTNLSTARGLPTQNLPPDMLYTNPTTVVFTR